MSRTRSQQSRVLRWRLSGHTVVAGLINTSLFIVLALVVNAVVVPRIAELVVAQTGGVTFTDDPEPYFALPNWEVLPVYDQDAEGALVESGLYEVRELSAYLAVRQLKVPLVILLYLAGCLGIVMFELARALRCFDALAEAVASLLTDRSKPVELPASLSIAQGELDRIRLEALADERAAAAAEQRKDELVVYLAHDIRTPLTSVIGYLSLLDEAEALPSEQRQRFIRTALQKAEGLEGLIDELFEITRYNLRSIPIERRRASVRLMLQQVADELYPQAAARDVALVVEAPEDASFFADADKLARALGNVLRNAVAYADAGTEVRLEARPADDGGWDIRVVDQGREISPAHLESIFEKFYREDAARSTDAGGAGLGLAIAREIATAHGGTIRAESDRGLTVFTLHLPAA